MMKTTYKTIEKKALSQIIGGGFGTSPRIMNSNTITNAGNSLMILKNVSLSP